MYGRVTLFSEGRSHEDHSSGFSELYQLRISGIPLVQILHFTTYKKIGAVLNLSKLFILAQSIFISPNKK